MESMDSMKEPQDVDPMAGMDMDMGMKMYFHGGAQAMILFKGWMTHDWQRLFGSCVAVFLMAMLYEGFKMGREILQQKMAAASSSAAVNEAFPVTALNKNEAAPEIYGATSMSRPLIGPKPTIIQRIFNASHFIQAMLQILQVWLSMCLMLVFMTFNVWLCLAVSLGAGVGYFTFAWLRTGPEDRIHDTGCH